MSSVDDRIVNMQFNNKQFTQGVQQSQRDLTGLDKTLANAGKSSGLGKMAGAASQVSQKFSVMQVAGVTAVATIANKVTLMAGSLLKKLTIQPLIDGFREYTTNLESVQTIMSNTGKSVDTVNKYLGQMNKYADQTIYNFSQMAKNVGTFTAAGVKLPTAVSAIKGIANLAALSGSNSQQASTAMYQLSQAIAAGKVGLQDWNSVVNAGMGGKVFKNALAQTAVAMGDLSSNAVKVGTDVEIMGASFRNSIMAQPGQESWLSSDVLVTTLATLDGRFSKTALAAKGYVSAQSQAAQIDKARLELAKQGVVYSDKEFDAMVSKADAAYNAATQIKTATQLFGVVQESIGSMWASAFGLILGDFEESKKLWGSVGDVVQDIIGGISGSFLGSLREWRKFGGRDAVIEGFGNAFGSLLAIMKRVTKAFQQVFPPTAGSALANLSKGFAAFTRALTPSKETLFEIRRIFTGVFAVLHIGASIISGVAKAFGSFFGALFSGTEQGRGGILAFAGEIGHMLKRLDMFLTQGGKLSNFLGGIGAVAGKGIKPIVQLISSIVGALGGLLSGNVSLLAESIAGIKNSFVDFIQNILNGLATVTSPIKGVSDFFADMATNLGGLKTTASEVWDSLMGGGGVGATGAGGLSAMSGGLSSIGDTLKSVGGFIKDTLGSITDAFHVVGSASEAAGDKVTDSFNAVNDVASSVKKTAGGAFDTVSQSAGAAADGGVNKMAAAGGTVKSIFSAMGGFITGFFSAIGDGFAWAAEKIGSIPWPQDALEWATLLNALIAGALVKKLLFSKGILETFKDTISGLGDSVDLVAKAWKDSFDQLTDTLKTMQGAIKAEMIKNIAIAVALLVASLVILSYIPTDKLANGMAALAATMLLAGTMMQVMMAGLKKISVKDLIKYGVGFALIGVGMMAMATAVLILTGAVLALAFVPFDALKQGLSAVAILMGIMTASLLLLSGQGAKVAAVGGAMALMAVAIDALVVAVLALGFIPFDALKQGLGAVAAGIGIMTASLLLLSGNSVKVLASAGAMVLVAGALDILIPLIVTLGLLPWDVVEQGLKSVGIGMAIMVGGLMLLAGGGPSILAAGAAMILIAGALNILVPLIVTLGLLPWEVVKQGLIALAIGLGIVVAAGYLAIGASAGLSALALVILAIGAAMFLAGAGMALFAGGLALLAAVGAAAVAVITLAIGAFIALLPNIAIAVAAAFVSFLQAIALAAPKIRKAMGTIITEMLGTVDDAIPKLKKTFGNLIEAGLEVIALYMSRYVLLGVQIVLAILTGLAENIPKIIDKAYEIAYAFIDGMGDRAVDLANAGADALIKMLNGFSEAVETKGPEIRKAVKRLATAIKNEFIEATKDLFTSIPMPDLPDWMSTAGGLIPGLGLLTKTKGGKFSVDFNMSFKSGKSLAEKLEESLTTAGATVAKAIEGAVRLLVGGDGSSLAGQYARQADAAQSESVYQSTRSGVLDKEATKAEAKVAKQREAAEKLKDKKKKQARLKEIREGSAKEARALRNKSDKAAKLAEKADAKASEASARSQQESSYQASVKDQDFQSAGDVRSEQGQAAADKAQALLAEAQAKSDRADKLAKGNKKDQEAAKQLRKEARRAADEANKLALDAIGFQAEAAAMYERARAAAQKAVTDRLASIRADLAERDAERQWQNEFDALEGNATAQAKMLNDRADKNAAIEAAARVAMETALNEAARLAATDAEGAMAQLDEAERQAQIASNAADAAEADRDKAEDLLKQTETAVNNGTTTSGAQITPSRSALEDAAGAVDRYTTSMQQAEEQAGAGSSSTQFIQNNYSPEALSASQLYRQGRNLVSAAQLKMAGDRD